MSKGLIPLLIAQFLSAFADNAILFTVIAMVMQSTELPSWYVPALQSVFLVSFVVLGPWVGGIADRYVKSKLLFVANVIKAIGAGLLFFHVEPLLAYCIVGLGAAIYSPAKYGILPELTPDNQLIKANSWIEGSTILAILTGMVVGARVADYSLSLALLGTLGLFFSSALLTLLIPNQLGRPKPDGSRFLLFIKQTRYFIGHHRSRFALLSASMFWGAAASVRVILVAWAPLVLMLHTATEIASLTLFLAIGIIIGSAITPWLIPMHHLRKTRFAAYAMGLMIFGLAFSTQIELSQGLLLLMGCAGGLFIVPINATLQSLGQHSIGSGNAVAMQNFFQNLSMLISVGLYTLAASMTISPITALMVLGSLLVIATGILSLILPATDKITDHQS